MTQRHKSSAYRLTRNFALGAAIIIVAAGAAVAELSRTLAVEQLERMAESNNSALTHTFANGVWGRFESFIVGAHELTPDQLRAHPQTAELRGAIETLMAGTSVVRIKLYDLNAITVFSTDAGQIGERLEDADDGEIAHFRKAAAGGTVSELERLDEASGDPGAPAERWVLSSYVPVQRGGKSGSVEGVVEIYTDVTDFYAYIGRGELLHVAVIGGAFLVVFVLLLAVVWRAEWVVEKQHRKNLELAASTARAEAASRAKSEFLANMSHELRTPLNAIIGFSTMVRDEVAGPVGNAKYREYAADIGTAGQHLLSVINDVLDLVRIDSGKMGLKATTLDLSQTVMSVVRLLETEASAAEVSISLETESRLKPIDTDETKLRQILVNLISNAIKFTPTGGSVSVKIRQEPQALMTRITVADTGIGMKETDIPVALAPFGQIDSALNRKYTGTGLGLPLSQRFARLLGGDLEIESALGEGTRITVILPTLAEVRETDPLAKVA
jgi:signal transduction histidine kinase